MRSDSEESVEESLDTAEFNGKVIEKDQVTFSTGNSNKLTLNGVPQGLVDKFNNVEKMDDKRNGVSDFDSHNYDDKI